VKPAFCHKFRVKVALRLGLLLCIATSFGLAACDQNPFASKEKRRKHDRDDDDDDRPRRKASATSSALAKDEGKRADRPITAGVTPVPVDLYVMSQCPYAVQAEAMFEPVLERLGPYLTFRVEYIGTHSGDELKSMHGPREVAGDLAQICAQKHSPRFFDLILCQNEAMKEVDTNWEACAQRLGLDKAPISTCVSGPEGKALLAASFDRAVAAGARGSPTIIIAGEKYAGTRKSPSIMSAICGKFAGTAPAECADLPQAPKVNVTILRDDRCTTCDMEKVEKSLAGKVSNPVVTKLEIGSADGKKLFDAIKPVKLPAFVFDATLDADADAVAAFKKPMREVGGHKVVESGDWNPACADAGGCASEACKLTLACRPDVPNRLDVFVMSQCPFAVKGLDSMKEVLANFKKSGAKVDFQVHYIGTGDAATGLKSMHGQPEVDEDLRQVCAIAHYPKALKFMDYIWCRNKDFKSTAWESCTGTGTGIDTNVIRTCSQGDEGKKLLEASFAYSKASGMSASPTWLANGKFKFSGIDAERIKTGLCDHSKLSGCQSTLTGPVSKPSGSAAAPAPKDNCATP